MKVPKGGSIYVDGMQYCDPTPVEMPLGYQVPEPLESMIARMCHDKVIQLELEKRNGGQDTEAEADDFEVDSGEDLDFEKSGYQMSDMQEEYVDLGKLQADSQAHAEREVNARMEEQAKAKRKQKVKRNGKAGSDTEEDVPVEDAQ